MNCTAVPFIVTDDTFASFVILKKSLDLDDWLRFARFIEARTSSALAAGSIRAVTV
jgi:hypothetical protein